MKAYLMWKDTVLRTELIADLLPEIKIPIRKVFNVAYMLEPELAVDHETNFICFVFRLKDHGREFAIYELDGFDGIPKATK